MNIPVKKAIQKGMWYKVTGIKITDSWEWNDDNPVPFDFRIRFLSYRKINIDEFDEPDYLSSSEGEFWLLSVEIVSLCKKTARPCHIKFYIQLIDQDGFEFVPSDDNYLTYDSNFARNTGLDQFRDVVPHPLLYPKIKAFGAFAFQLPEDEFAEYFIKLSEGRIEEI